MTKCNKCGEESGNLFCGKCRAKIMKLYNIIPILFYDKNQEGYRAGCTVLLCPNNENGICKTVHITLDSIKNVMHEFDGDNIVQQVCG